MPSVCRSAVHHLTAYSAPQRKVIGQKLRNSQLLRTLRYDELISAAENISFSGNDRANYSVPEMNRAGLRKICRNDATFENSAKSFAEQRRKVEKVRK